MKKFSVVIMALALMAGLTQCKKNTSVLNTVTDSDSVYITINVENNGKADVNTENGMVTYNKYDRLYVVSNGIYVGELQHNGDGFSGSISGAITDMPLYFYFLGDVTPENKLYAGETTRCSVNISNQKTKLPVISCGYSNELFSRDNGTYNVKLYNKCALVKFNVKTTSSESVCISGVNNFIEIDFQRNSFTYDQVDGGIIKLAEGEGDRWAIMLPGDEVLEGEMGTAFTEDYVYWGKRPAIAAINDNDFVTGGYNVEVITKSTGDGKYSVSENKKVLFAKGNVQYIASESGKHPYWKFADNQYDVLPNADAQCSGAENIDRDLFGWGTGDTPNNVSTNDSDYPDTFVDWGKHFGNGEEWRTLECVEWRYVFYERRASKINDVYDARYARAKVNDVNGVIIFPDVYEHPDDVKLPEKKSINYTNKNHDGTWSDNQYSKEEWTKMELAGATFLPVAGQRDGVISEKDSGHYWSKCSFSPRLACNLFFTDYRPYFNDDNNRHKGFSVRLVRE